MLGTKTAKRKKQISDDVLDNLMRRYIKLISGGYCKRCKEYVGVGMLDISHIYGRKRKTVRWDIRNVYPLCRDNPRTGRKGCHYRIDNDAIEKTSFLYDVLPIKEIENLQRLANMTLKEYPIDRKKIKAELKQKIDWLETHGGG